ncbi:MAG: class I SAM-dependent methyltransferase [Armatimonadetes bacterium]|nr:class I SAM-dependent methyltransferase [Armatimonadota bacterium]
MGSEDKGGWLDDVVQDLKRVRLKDAVKEAVLSVHPEWKRDYWKREVQDFYGWDQKGDPEVYHKICTGCHTADEFYANTESIVYLADPGPEDVCFNIGCGAGRVEFHLADRVKRIHSVDFSESMVELAREKCRVHSNVAISRNDGESLAPLEDAAFDLGWCELVFQHVPRHVTDAYLQEVRRVLKPGGRFVCNIPRLDRYGNTVTCGGFTRRQVDRLVRSRFSGVEYLNPDNPYHHVVLLTR